MIARLTAILFSAAIVVLSGCAANTGRMPTMADMDVVAQDSDFALVRLKTGQDFAALAHVFFGSASEGWQLTEVNGNHAERAGQVVAVPLRPVNSSSVYVNGYRTLPILCYHQFTAKSKAGHQLELSAAAFEEQIRFLIDNGYNLLSFADVDSILRKGQSIPEKSAVITIDDGYRSVYDVAWPILKKYRAPATLFIYTDFIGAPAALSWEQLEEMAASGFIEVESHAKSHSSLSRQAQDKTGNSYTQRLHKEIAGSNNVFRQKMGSQARYLSYPYGDSSASAQRVAREEGIQLAATVTRGDNTTFSDPYLLHRTMIYDSHSLSDFRKLLRVFREKNLQ